MLFRSTLCKFYLNEYNGETLSMSLRHQQFQIAKYLHVKTDKPQEVLS